MDVVQLTHFGQRDHLRLLVTPVPVAEVIDIGVNNSNVIPIKPGQSTSQVIGSESIIGVQEADELGVRRLQTRQSGLARIVMIDAEIPHAPISPASHDFSRVVGRGIVDDESLVRSAALDQYALQAFVQILTVVVRGDNDRQRGQRLNELLASWANLLSAPQGHGRAVVSQPFEVVPTAIAQHADQFGPLRSKRLRPDTTDRIGQVLASESSPIALVLGI